MLAEDSAALAGLLMAAAGIYLCHHFNMPKLDGATSVLIDLLAGVAVLLIGQSRSLLIGAGIRPETSGDIRAMAPARPGVAGIGKTLSMYIGPDEVLVTIDLDFEDGTETTEAAETLSVIQRKVRARFPMIRRFFIKPRTLPANQNAADSASGGATAGPA